jgi:uncharacterized membrane protein YbaN (DUF454 family)
VLSPALRKILDWGVGVSLILLGITGLVLPILPGWIFIIAGLAVLSSHSRWAMFLLQKLQGIGRAVRSKVRRE